MYSLLFRSFDDAMYNTKYPLVTHDPNMLKNKSRGNLVGKIKIVSFRREMKNFWQKQFTLVQEVLQSSKYSTMMCDVQSPFLISKTRNNSPLSRATTFFRPFLFTRLHIELFFIQQLSF